MNANCANPIKFVLIRVYSRLKSNDEDSDLAPLEISQISGLCAHYSLSFILASYVHTG
jgi:hypothetical protein